MRLTYLRVQIGNDGLVVQFNGQTIFKINMPCKYNGNVCGLLGNADNDPTNDNLMPGGSPAESHNQLGKNFSLVTPIFEINEKNGQSPTW